MSKVEISSLVSDNMVLQRDVKDSIWGWTQPGEKVELSLNGKKAKAEANEQGRWEAKIGPFAAGGPHEMTINTKDTSKTITNIMIGEVWVCSGQSNMEMLVGPIGWSAGVLDAEKEIAEANYPAIRQFSVEKQVSGKPLKDVKGSWMVCSPKTVKDFSAIAYFFGRDIHKKFDVPVGLINAPWGGMPAQSFVSREALLAEPELAGMITGSEKSVQEYPQKFDQYVNDLEKWRQKTAQADAEGKPSAAVPEMPADPRSAPIRPAGLYNAMISPLMPYAMKGVIWYQGETNAMGPANYHTLFPTLIKDWRRAWGEGDFPFLFVQLANYDATGGWTKEYSWAHIREAQLKTLSLPKTGMAVAADIGESKNIHPRNKQEVGHRLALAAYAIGYGEQIPSSGPIYESMSVEGNKVRLRFKYADSGLVAKDESGAMNAIAGLRTFVIAGADKKFVPAQAKIDGESILVWSDEVKEPAAARYAWLNDPVGCNLYNKVGLPASPFRTDDWTDDGLSPKK